MHRKAWGYGLSIVLALSTMASARPQNPLPSFMDARKGSTEAVRIVGLDSAIPFDGEITPEMGKHRDRDAVPGRDPMGETFEIGTTWYDYQANGTISKMIAQDADGGTHFVWMKGNDAGSNTRHMVWNFMENDNLLYAPDESPVVDNGSRSGYGSLALLPADQRTMVFYHVIGPPDHPRDYVGSAQAYDFARGFGAFNSGYPNPWPNTQILWPHGTVSRNNVTHMLATENGDFPVGNGQLWQRISYWRGDPDRDFQEWGWTDPGINIDTASTISTALASSVTSDRVVMAFFHNRVGTPLDTWDQVAGWWQKNNDIRYIVSENGRDFDFRRNIKSLTKIIDPRPDLAEFDMNEAYGDTFRPYCDVDIQFDPWGDDNLYAVFPTAGFFEEPVEDDDPEPADGATAEHCILWFWSEHGGEGGTDTVTFMYDGYYFNRTDNGGSWHSRCGGWRMNADRGSIAFDPERPGWIYVTWVSFPKIQELNPDYDPNNPEAGPPFLYDFPAQDTSTAGFKGAEVMVSISNDYGITWREPINVTETFWQGNEAPQPGEMESEAWQSVAYLADGFLHIAYVKDTDAGGIPQEEGTATNSPWIYQRISLDDLQLNDPVQLPVEDFTFHNNLDFRPVIPEDRVGRNPGTPNPANQVTVTATVTGGGDHALDAVYLVYRINGENETEVEMATVDGDVWGATIPRQAEGTTVWYRVRARNDVGLSSVAPQTNWWWGYVVRNAGEMTIRDVQERPDDWQSDYSFYRGYTVTVSGVVTTPASFNQTYGAYAIQDGAAAWAGVFVRGIDDNLNPGDRIEVTGMVYERDMEDSKKWEYETYILADSYQVIAQGQALPNALRLSGVNDLLYSNGVEALEGCLVELRDFEVDSLNNPPMQPEDRTHWPIKDAESTDDGYFTTIGLSDADINQLGIRNFVWGTEISRIVGVLSENYGYYGIAMRDRNDLGPNDVSEEKTPTPFKFRLHPAYPNPFNGLTTLSFSLPRKADATLGIFDLNGREIARIAEGRFEAGQHLMTVDASELANGVYLLQLESSGRTSSQKIVLVK